MTCLFSAFIISSCSKDNRTSPDDDIYDDGGDTTTKIVPLLNSINTKSWTLMFSDEFDKYEASNWVKDNSVKSRAGRPGIGITQWFWKPENVSYKDGNVILKSSKVSENTLHCGSISSNNLVEFKYGYIEARIDIAETMFGTHTALWLQGDNMGRIDGTGNDGAEIDVFESAWVGDYTKSVVHIDGYGGSHKANTRKYDTPGIHSGYHVYGLLWDEDKLEIYYDGQFMTRYQGIWVPQVEEFLWLSTGASFGGTADFTSRAVGSSTEAKVDYIRVWNMN
ncbi:family 16 glycosylhydrolase [Bacteroidota bacterium]